MTCFRYDEQPQESAYDACIHAAIVLTSEATVDVDVNQTLLRLKTMLFVTDQSLVGQLDHGDRVMVVSISSL